MLIAFDLTNGGKSTEPHFADTSPGLIIIATTGGMRLRGPRLLAPWLPDCWVLNYFIESVTQFKVELPTRRVVASINLDLVTRQHWINYQGLRLGFSTSALVTGSALAQLLDTDCPVDSEALSRFDREVEV